MLQYFPNSDPLNDFSGLSDDKEEKSAHFLQSRTPPSYTDVV